MKKIFRLIIYSCILLTEVSILHSCSKEPNDYPNLPTRTILVYLAADNDLADIGRTPELLRQGWGYTGNNCLIYYDAPNETPKLLALECGCSDPTPYIVTVAEYAEENSSSADVFKRVLDDVVRMYPSDSYGLIFASHASGWLPNGTLSNPGRSVGSDRDPGTTGGTPEMELADFAAAIPDRQFDFIIFETCLMSGVEVVYELRNKTDYLLASSAELLAPGYGLIYPRASKYLFDTSIDIRQGLVGFAECYIGHVNTLNGVYRSATQSIVYTREMDALAALAGEVLGSTNSFMDEAAIADLQHFDRPGSYGDTPAKPRYFDFAEYMVQLAPQRQAQVEALLGRIVVWKAATPTFMAGQNGFVIRTHCGLTTYIEQRVFPALNAGYKKTAWWRATRNVQ